MNEELHTHDVGIRRQWADLDGTGSWVITYGDARVLVTHWPPFREARIRRGVRRVVRKHDRGSVAAGRRRDTTDRFAEIARTEANRVAGEAWTKPSHPGLREAKK